MASTGTIFEALYAGIIPAITPEAEAINNPRKELPGER